MQATEASVCNAGRAHHGLRRLDRCLCQGGLGGAATLPASSSPHHGFERVGPPRRHTQARHSNDATVGATARLLHLVEEEELEVDARVAHRAPVAGGDGENRRQARFSAAVRSAGV